MTKWIVSLFVMIAGIQAHAAIANDGFSRTQQEHCGYNSEATGACMISIWSVSWPSITVEGQNMDLNSPEASDRLVAEVDGVVQPVLLSRIAKDNHLELEKVMAVAASLPDLNMQNLVQALR